jgi:predicted transcriptional regulator
MPRKIGSGLSMREREMLDILHRLGKATAADVQEALSDPPSYSAVRSILRILEDKGHVIHAEGGKRYVYSPVEPQTSAARNALQTVVRNFFGGSLEHAVSAFLADSEAEISNDELKRLSEKIAQAAREDSELKPQ